MSSIKRCTRSVRQSRASDFLLRAFSSQLHSQFIAGWMAWHQRTLPNFVFQLHRIDQAIVCDRYIFTVKLSAGFRSFFICISGPAVWNALSDYLRDPSLSIDLFKRYLKPSCLLHINTTLQRIRNFFVPLRYINNDWIDSTNSLNRQHGPNSTKTATLHSCVWGIGRACLLQHHCLHNRWKFRTFWSPTPSVPICSFHEPEQLGSEGGASSSQLQLSGTHCRFTFAPFQMSISRSQFQTGLKTHLFILAFLSPTLTLRTIEEIELNWTLHKDKVGSQALTTMDLQRRSCMAGDQKVMRPSWLQAMNDPSGGVSTTRRIGSRCGVAHDLAGSWKPTCLARR